jgi:tryptophanyl-tRNA synthetase
MARIMTGARPTGGLHIGQFFAAFRPFVQSSFLNGSFFVVSDLHMLTTKFTPASTRTLHDAVRQLVAEAIGFGVNPTVTTFYLQSQVQWQARIYAILQSLAPVTRLEQQVSFEEMARHSAHVRPPTLGLLGYPVLESSDVISIGATHVTVGQSNLGHFELMRDLIAELQAGWGLDLAAPQVVVGRSNLIGLDGSDKMSKSAGNAIFFADESDTIADKVRSMALTGDKDVVVPVEYLKTLEAPEDLCHEVEERVQSGASIGDALEEIADRVVALTAPVRQRAAEVLADGHFVDGLLAAGCEKADTLGRSAYDTLTRAIGIPRLS